jgi:stearoyl-CoA desaturase (Delta-9 desaturase)
MWFLVGGVGVSVGLHRHFSHRAFVAKPSLRAAMAMLGCMAGQGTVSYWVALHRSHHTHSDRPGNLHSPVPAAHDTSNRWLAFLQGHIGWVWRHDVPSPIRYAADLIRDPLVVRIDRFYNWIVLSGIALPGLAGIAIWGGFNGFLIGAYWGGLAFGHHIIWAINSLCHFSGNRPYDTGDQSSNVGWLSILSFGESWHNNHHQYPTSARFKHHWWQSDSGWAFIRLAKRLNFASSVKQHQT